MSQPPESFSSNYEEPEFGSGITKLVKEKPAVALGVLAMCGTLGYGYRRFKTQGFTFTPSLFIMQLRVGAQAAVVGCLMTGMLYKMVNDHILNKKTEH